MKRKFYYWSFLWILIIGSLAGCHQQDSYFMKISDYNVEKEEYTLLAYDNVSLTAIEYGQKYNVDVNSDDFWSRAIDGQTPMERLKELTDETIIVQKGIQICAMEEGLLTDISYQAFLKQYEEENSTRKEKSNQGDVIYGPLQFTALQYYSYRQSLIEQTLLEHLEAKAILTEEALKEHYLIMEGTEGKKNFQADLLITVWPVSSPNQKSTYEVKIDTLDLGKENQAFERVVEAVKSLEIGESSELLDLGQEMEGIIQVESKEYVPFGSYEDRRSFVEQQLREQMAKIYVEKKIRSYQVTRGREFQQLSYKDILK